MSILGLRTLKNLNVLYIEDNPFIAEQTTALLNSYFHTVFHACSAEDGLELFDSQMIHVIITDIELPGMNGLEFCKLIRKKKSTTPIIITTVHNNKEMLLEAIKLNLVDYLIKPVSITDIQKTLTEAIKKLGTNGDCSFKINDNVSYNPLSAQLEVSGKPVKLNHSEFALLDLLIINKNKIVTYETVKHTLDPDNPISDAAFKSLLYRLRKKIGKESIVSVSGIGIKLLNE